MFFANTEYYPSLKYHTKEFLIRLWLSVLAMTMKYTTDLASSEQIPRVMHQPLNITFLTCKLREKTKSYKNLRHKKDRFTET